MNVHSHPSMAARASSDLQGQQALGQGQEEGAPRSRGTSPRNVLCGSWDALVLLKESAFPPEKWTHMYPVP